MTQPRRFPPPWSIEDIGAAFVVKNSAGQKLGYFYYAEEPGRRSAADREAKKIGGAGALPPNRHLRKIVSAALIPGSL